jgi:hypothetical protein
MVMKELRQPEEIEFKGIVVILKRFSLETRKADRFTKVPAWKVELSI